MGTLGQIVESVRHSLSGFDANKESVLELTSSVSASAKELPIDDGSAMGGASRGVAEVNMELVRVKSLDATTPALVLYSFGRGYRGTPAVAHPAGSEVRVNPAWPASSVAAEVNGVLNEVYPRVYGVRYHETAFPARGGAIDLPADATGVVAVYVNDPRRDDEWVREDRWSFQPDSSDVGRALRVGGRYNASDRLRIVYSVRPGLFDLSGSLSQDFETVTGLDSRVQDLVRLGVAARMAPFVDVAKLPFLGAAARGDGELRGPTTGSTVARLLYSMFQARVDQEAAVLNKEHPIRLHFTGRL